MLFRLAEVEKSYGAHPILRGVTFQVNPGEHIGLVGRNGAGKTTILRLISGAESPDKGGLERQRSLKVGVLAQHVDFRGSETLMDAALSVFDELHRIEVKMRALEHDMNEVTGDELDRVMHDYSELQHSFEHNGGFTFHARTESVLQGLGFAQEEFSKIASSLSGGEKNRLGLAKLLLLEPDILLLDEPTNHLDVDAVEWLEEFLSSYKSAYLIISHDRFFLDHTVNRILDLELGKIDDYRGNYSKYLVEKEERREQQQRAYEQQQEMIAKTEDYIRRNIAGQKTKQAKSRRKMLEKIDRIENINNMDTASFKLNSVTRTGDLVLVSDKVAIGYGQKILAPNISFTLRRGDRLGIIGGNGTGKTTFLRTILGENEPCGGEFRWGTGVNTGYYDQRLLTVDDRNIVIEELRTVASSSVTDGQLRGFLGRFLFSGDDAFKSVSALSGGEKGRLALAKLIYSGHNVLLLDEPTNHLDIASCEALEDSLNQYGGTIVTVSHDRYFLDRIANKILFFSEHGVEYFDGGYSEFYDAHHKALAEKRSAELEAIKAEKVVTKVSKPKPTPAKKTKVKEPTPDEIEAEIQSLEEDLKKTAELMSSDEIVRDKIRLLELSEHYQSLDSRIKELYRTWESLLNS